MLGLLRSIWKWIFPPIEVQVKIGQEDLHEDDDSVRTGEGIITLLDRQWHNFVIDRKYQGESDVVKGRAELKKDMRVKYKIKYNAEEDEWKVLTVEPVLTDDQTLFLENCSFKKCNYIVRRVRNDSQIVELSLGLEERHEILEVSLDLMPKDGAVQRGDWLAVEWNAPKDSKGDEATIVSVDWVDKTIVEGVLTQVPRTSFTHVKGVYVSKELCDKVKCPAQPIKVIAIDSDRFTSDGMTYTYRKRAINVILPKGFKIPEIESHEPEDWNEEKITEEEQNSGRIKELLQDKFRVSVKPPRGVIGDVKIGSPYKKEFKVENRGDGDLYLNSVKVAGIQDAAVVEVMNLKDGKFETVIIPSSKSHLVEVQGILKEEGETKEMIVFEFQGFSIGRFLLMNTKAPCRNFNRRGTRDTGRSSEAFTRTTEIMSVSAVRQAFFIPNQLGQFHIPEPVANVFELENEDQLQSLYPGVDFTVLTEENYQERFHVALYFEELEQGKIRRESTLVGLELHVANIPGCYSFIVPSFQELGFPVQRADPVRLEDVDNPRIRYDGFVEAIRQADQEVVVKLSEQFDYVTSMLVNVQFRMGRTPFRRQHFAIDQAVKYLGKDWLFPQTVQVQLPRVLLQEDDLITEHPRPNPTAVIESLRAHIEKRVSKERRLGVRATSLKTVKYEVQVPNQALMDQRLRWYNPQLNSEQKNAVRRVLRGQGRPLPYVIFGPPGTGKTVTVVEAIMQIYFTEKVSRILVTVPSNAGADIIAELLVKSFQFKPGDFVRLNGYSRSDSAISDLVAPFCVDGDHLDSIAKHRLIISTVVTAGQFLQLSLYTGHFSHVFIDEAGYCTEPEALIPSILSAIDREGQIILAGDPKQLGPVLKCNLVVNSILSKSFLERIMETPVYCRTDDEIYDGCHYNPIVLTKLVRNYRSHPSLLKVASKLFYDDELQPCAPKNLVSELTSLKFLPKRGEPLIFHGVKGYCMQDADSPSCYNLSEAGAIARYVQMLKNEGLKDEDIGIITPYRKQVDKIRETLCMQLQEVTSIKVASVQEFQGGEKTVILISTVRASRNSDVKEQALDFLHCEKLFNVAVTRAKALMIIVGDPEVLYPCSCWREMLQYCVELGVYKGCDLPAVMDNKLLKVVDETEKQINQVQES